MKKEDKVQQTYTIEDVLEQFGILRAWHKTAYIISAVLIACMIGFVAWGIMFEPMRVLLIAFGVVMGICGAVLFITMRKTYLKTGAAILDYFRKSGMSEEDILKKAEELKISVPKGK